MEDLSVLVCLKPVLEVTLVMEAYRFVLCQPKICGGFSLSLRKTLHNLLYRMKVLFIYVAHAACLNTRGSNLK